MKGNEGQNFTMIANVGHREKNIFPFGSREDSISRLLPTALNCISSLIVSLSSANYVSSRLYFLEFAEFSIFKFSLFLFLSHSIENMPEKERIPNELQLDDRSRSLLYNAIFYSHCLSHYARITANMLSSRMFLAELG